MPTYIGLGKSTDQGARNIKTIDTPERFEAGIKHLEEMGCKLIGYYRVMGEYDRVVIMEAPNDEVAMSTHLKRVSLGDMTGILLRAFTQEEYLDMVKKLP